MNLMSKVLGKKDPDWVNEQFGDYQKKGLDSPIDPSYTGGEAKKYDIDKVANCTDGTYPNNLIRLAQLLRDMKISYALQASEFAKNVFSAQDELDLNGAEMEVAIKNIIKQREVINETTFKAMQVIAKNFKATS
jgi:hypothetical protein